MGRIRVAITIERDVWEEFKANLAEKGYPKGTASYTIQRHLEHINTEFEVVGNSSQLNLLNPRKGD